MNDPQYQLSEQMLKAVKGNGLSCFCIAITLLLIMYDQYQIERKVEKTFQYLVGDQLHIKMELIEIQRVANESRINSDYIQHRFDEQFPPPHDSKAPEVYLPSEPSK